jgi:hypothetical protein
MTDAPHRPAPPPRTRETFSPNRKSVKWKALHCNKAIVESLQHRAVQYNILVLLLESLSDAVEKKNQV